MSTWDEFQQAVRKWDHAVLLTSSDSDLDAFEVACGVKLPESYREFAKTFGRCELGNVNLFQFAAPGHGNNKMSFSDLDSLNSEMGKNARSDRDAIGRSAVFFGSDEHGDTYGWNPSEVTDPQRGEFAIYLRTDSNVPYKRVASTFDEFVLVHCFGEELQTWRDASAAGEDDSTEDSEDEDAEEDPRILLQPM
jgi:SMI1-KNR4 cell-wall